MLSNMSIFVLNATTASCTAVVPSYNMPKQGTTHTDITDSTDESWAVVYMTILFISIANIIYNIRKIHPHRKAFTNARDMLADHGLVTARLFIETSTGQVTSTHSGGACESFDIVFGSGASLDNKQKGINDQWNFLDHKKVSEITVPFTRDAVIAYNTLWQTLYSDTSDVPQFHIADPKSFATTHKALEKFLIANPRPSSAVIRLAITEYIGRLILAVEMHIGSSVAMKIHSAIWPDTKYYGSTQDHSLVHDNSGPFYTACLKNIFTKPAVLLRDFSSLIGWQPMGGFVVDATSPYVTQTGVCGAVKQAIPMSGTGVLSLAEGLAAEWLNHSDSEYFCSNPNTSVASPCSVHWNAMDGNQGWGVIGVEAHWVAGELAGELRSQFDNPDSEKATVTIDTYLRALKDAYVITLHLKHQLTEMTTVIRYGQVHFDSTMVNARKYVMPAIIAMMNKYDLHAIGGDTNVTASKDENHNTSEDIANGLRRIVTTATTYPYAIEKTRLPGDLLMNSQTLTKYGTTCEHDGMIAVTA